MLVFEQIYKMHKQDVFHYLLSLTHDVNTAEDLLSECFLIALRKLPFFRGDSSVKTWLFGIARNCWLRHLSKKQPTIPLDYAAMEEALADITNSIFTKEIAERIISLMNDKDERAQITLKMRINGYSYREIAEHLCISEGSVRVIYHRTRKQLKEQLSREGYGLDVY